MITREQYLGSNLDALPEIFKEVQARIDANFHAEHEAQLSDFWYIFYGAFKPKLDIVVGIMAVAGHTPAAAAIAVFFYLHELVLHATSIQQVCC